MSERVCGCVRLAVGGVVALCVGVGALEGCESEEKVVRYKPFLAGLTPALQEGMTLKQGTEPVLNDSRVRPVDPGEVPDNKIVIVNEDKSERYISRSPVHVMRHVERCLDEEKDKPLLDQIVASSTKEHYRAQGKDPMVFIESLHERRKDIAKLFSRMPQGESSPTVQLRQFPDRVWRLDVVGGYAKDLVLTRLWVQMESGQWKLMWVD